MAATARLIDEAEGRELCSPAVAKLLRLPRTSREEFLRSMPASQLAALRWSWEFWARPDQLWRPGWEAITAYLAGRGWGKTLVGAQAVRYVARHPELCGGRARRGSGDRHYGRGGVIGIAGRTANDVNQTMIYGTSGIMACSPPNERPTHHKSDKILEWPNGVIARLMSGDVPASFRGPEFGFLWADELAHWARAEASWLNAMLALRHGHDPKAIVTTTPIGTQLVKELIFELRDGDFIPAAEYPEHNDGRYAYRNDVRVVRGSTYDNAANLPRSHMQKRVAGFEGSRLADQELRGVILFQIPGSIWSYEWFRRCELHEVPGISCLYDQHGEATTIEIDHTLKVILAIDPTVSEKEFDKNDDPVECGMVVIAFHPNGNAYVLEDASGQMSPKGWATRAVQLCDRWGVDEIAVEDNQGGALVETNLRVFAPRLPVEIVRVHATKNKGERAGLVSPLWNAGRVWHVGNPRAFVRMEHQMTHFDASKPAQGQPSDRMDALVWGFLRHYNDGSDSRRFQALSNIELWKRIQAEVASRRLGGGVGVRPFGGRRG